MAKIIESLTDYMLAARQTKLPPEVIQKGKSHLLDSLAAIVSGSVTRSFSKKCRTTPTRSPDSGAPTEPA